MHGAYGEELAQSTGFEWLARAGFLARGAIYVVIGILAVKLATGSSGTTANQQGALAAVARQPLGKVLLVLLAVGFAGYALWRLMRALLGRGPEGADRGLDRVAAFVSGLVYAGLCAIAVEVLVGSDASSSGNGRAAGVFGWPAGTWLVGIAGAVVVGVGVYQAYKGISREFLEDSKTEQMGHAVRESMEALGMIGYVARAIVLCLVGVFLVKAAVEFDPNKAVGLDGALAKLAHASYGPILLGLVAAGFIAFGVYSLADARYRRI
jgi:Domain of Unknown Function (DUF1206)